MGTTTGDALPFPEEGELVAPFEGHFEDLALAVQVALSRRPRYRHREFTTRRDAQPTGGYYAQTLASADDGTSTADTIGFAYVASGTNALSFQMEPGYYNIEWFGFLGAVANGRSLAELATAGDGIGGNVLARAVEYSGEDRITLAVQDYRVTADMRFWLRTYRASATAQANVTGRLKITKVADL